MFVISWTFGVNDSQNTRKHDSIIIIGNVKWGKRIRIEKFQTSTSFHSFNIFSHF